MNSIWLKIAAAAVAVVVVIVMVGRFGGGGNKPAPEPKPKDKTFYDMADRDRQFATAPKPAEEPASEPAQPQPAPEPQSAQAEQPAAQPAQPAQPSAEQASGVVLPSSITQPTTLYFIPLDEAEDVAAQELLPWASTGRSLGRLPMLQYGPMVKACRDILERWPESSYAFRAKQMLEEIYERHGTQYHITPQEMDISRFLKPRKGAQPVTVEPVQQ